MQTLIANKNNIFTSAFNAGTKTLSLSNITMFDMQFYSLISVYDVTVAAFFNFENMFTPQNFNKTRDSNGFWVYNWIFDQIPAGAANGDTLNIFIDVPDVFVNYTVLQVIAGATI